MPTLEKTARFTLTLPVADLERSTRFYRQLLDREPNECDRGGARFEHDEPPLALLLVPGGGKPAGTLNHLGLRWLDSTGLVAVQRRLEEQGFATQRQEGVECCYARQTKFWVTDPDGHLIEIYTLHEDLEHSGFEDAPGPSVASAKPKTMWQHRLPEPVPQRIDAADASIDSIELEGTFNGAYSPATLSRLLAETRRVLKPGGSLTVHLMVADRAVNEKPDLPGIAALVDRVPAEAEIVDALRAAGFCGFFYDTFNDITCIGIGGIKLYHLRLLASHGGPKTEGTFTVLYKGPFAQLRDDTGITLPRGRAVTVTHDVWVRLKNGPAANQMLFFPTPGS
jgi:catechol 2,3-dioxygenase-like lactoylglutathione lyase family enzyme